MCKFKMSIWLPFHNHKSNYMARDMRTCKRKWITNVFQAFCQKATDLSIAFKCAALRSSKQNVRTQMTHNQQFISQCVSQMPFFLPLYPWPICCVEFEIAHNSRPTYTLYNNLILLGGEDWATYWRQEPQPTRLST